MYVCNVCVFLFFPRGYIFPRVVSTNQTNYSALLRVLPGRMCNHTHKSSPPGRTQRRLRVWVSMRGDRSETTRGSPSALKPPSVSSFFLVQMVSDCHDADPLPATFNRLNVFSPSRQKPAACCLHEKPSSGVNSCAAFFEPQQCASCCLYSLEIFTWLAPLKNDHSQIWPVRFPGWLSLPYHTLGSHCSPFPAPVAINPS